MLLDAVVRSLTTGPVPHRWPARKPLLISREGLICGVLLQIKSGKLRNIPSPFRYIYQLAAVELCVGFLLFPRVTRFSSYYYHLGWGFTHSAPEVSTAGIYLDVRCFHRVTHWWVYDVLRASSISKKHYTLSSLFCTMKLRVGKWKLSGFVTGLFSMPRRKNWRLFSLEKMDPYSWVAF